MLDGHDRHGPERVAGNECGRKVVESFWILSGCDFHTSLLLAWSGPTILPLKTAVFDDLQNCPSRLKTEMSSSETGMTGRSGKHPARRRAVASSPAEKTLRLFQRAPDPLRSQNKKTLSPGGKMPLSTTDNVATAA